MRPRPPKDTKNRRVNTAQLAARSLAAKAKAARAKATDARSHRFGDAPPATTTPALEALAASSASRTDVERAGLGSRVSRVNLQALGLGRPTNRRHRASPLEPLSAKARRATTWVVDRTPAKVRERLPELSRLRRVARATGRVLLVAYVLLVGFTLARAFIVEGRYHDRSEELRRLELQLAEERSRTEMLRSQQAALARRSDVQIDAIRRELNMLREGERFYVFR